MRSEQTSSQTASQTSGQTSNRASSQASSQISSRTSDLPAGRLLVTTSGGVLACDVRTGDVERAIRVKTRRYTGFFGIAQSEPDMPVWAACRDRLGTTRVRKHSTDVVLWRIDPVKLEAEPVWEMRDIHDVHQIAVWDDRVVLTDTGLNRLHVYDLRDGTLVRLIEVGPERDDINHLNALLVEDPNLLVGMNNRGRQDAAVLSLPLSEIGHTDGSMDALEIGQIRPLEGVVHTHDLERLGEDLLVSASHDGRILKAFPPRPYFDAGGWSRGLAISDEGIWVGLSRVARRRRRHSRWLPGEVALFSHGEGRVLRRFTLKGAGQVNDLLLV